MCRQLLQYLVSNDLLAGTWTLENYNVGLEAISNALFTRVLGWSKPELDVFLAGVRKDIKNQAIHAYWPM